MPETPPEPRPDPPRRPPRSIRGALLGWYGLVLAAVLASFGATLYRSAVQALATRDDALIENRSVALAGGVSLDDDDGWELELSPDYLRAVAETTPFAIWEPGGKVLAAQGMTDLPPAPPAPGFHTRGQRREHVARSAAGVSALVGLTPAADRVPVRAWLSSIVLGGAAVLALALLGGWWLASRTMAPIARMSERASAISGRDLSVRLDPAAVPAELRGLCETLNQTFTRLEQAFARQTHFTADASHELRTPLSIVRAQIEVALQRPRTSDEYQHTLAVCLASVERMTGIVEGLLTLARAEAGAERLARDQVQLDGVVRAVAENLRPAADQRRLSLHLHLQPAVVRGDRHRLADVATNLLSNAIRYNRNGGRVEIAVAPAPDGVELRVADNGIGVPPEARAKIFDRFYRVDAARSRAAGGAGLGLAITKWIVEAHGGRIDFDDNTPGGSVFTVHLPGPEPKSTAG